jgi:hypothetical protein
MRGSAPKTKEISMSEEDKAQVISRRKMLSLLGTAAELGIAGTPMLATLDAEAQAPASPPPVFAPQPPVPGLTHAKRRQARRRQRRQERHERREARRARGHKGKTKSEGESKSKQ